METGRKRSKDAVYSAPEPVQNEVRRAFTELLFYMLIYWFDFPLVALLMTSLLSRFIGALTL
jgi:hypothetical protein